MGNPAYKHVQSKVKLYIQAMQEQSVRNRQRRLAARAAAAAASGSGSGSSRPGYAQMAQVTPRRTPLTQVIARATAPKKASPKTGAVRVRAAQPQVAQVNAPANAQAQPRRKAPKMVDAQTQVTALVTVATKATSTREPRTPQRDADKPAHEVDNQEQRRLRPPISVARQHFELIKRQIEQMEEQRRIALMNRRRAHLRQSIYSASTGNLCNISSSSDRVSQSSSQPALSRRRAARQTSKPKTRSAATVIRKRSCSFFSRFPLSDDFARAEDPPSASTSNTSQRTSVQSDESASADVQRGPENCSLSLLGAYRLRLLLSDLRRLRENARRRVNPQRDLQRDPEQHEIIQQLLIIALDELSGFLKTI